MISSTLGIFPVIYLSLKHIVDLRVEPSQTFRYLLKSLNLYWCYMGFDQKKLKSLGTMWSASKAAFLCCAYDVVTDWHSFSKRDQLTYQRILTEYASDDLAQMAIDLYEKELTSDVRNDGLERGSIAFHFVIKMMEIERNFNDHEEIGHFLQIVDDILDYESDLLHGDLNCLTTKRKNMYLTLLIKDFTMERAERLFPHGFFLHKVIRIARKKAINMLQENQSNVEKSSPVISS